MEELLPKIFNPEVNESLLNIKGVSIRAVLDTQRKLADNTYPVKLRIIYNRQYREYGIKASVTIEDFKILASGKTKAALKDVRIIIHGQIKRAATIIIEEMDQFSYDEFKSLFSEKKKEWSKVSEVLDIKIAELTSEGRIGHADTFKGCKQSFNKYLGDKKFANLEFKEITVKWLQDYQAWMLKEKKSVNTIGIYLRSFKVVYKLAESKKVVNPNAYPFGNSSAGKFQITTGRNIKKALDDKDLKKFFFGKPANDQQQKAKDFWIFSFVSYGLNMKDLVHLKWSNVTNDSIVYIRAKTQHTVKEVTPISVPLTEFSRAFIAKYGTPSTNPDDYVFNIISHDDTPEIMHGKVKHLTRFINQHVQEYCTVVKLPDNITTYYARHTFATKAILQGMSLEFVADALSHTDIKTTRKYFKGFDSKTKSKFSESLLKF